MALSESYRARVAHALEDVGLDPSLSDDACALVSWSIKQGHHHPWWTFHERRIFDIEGGYENVHASVMAKTIGLVKQGEHDLPNAARVAGVEFRAEIRRQYDVGEGPVDAPDSLQRRAGAMARTHSGLSESEAMDHIIHLHADEDELPPPFDETQMTDPRLIQAWEMATPGQREVLRLVADGITIQQASAHLGGTDSLAQLRINRLRSKLEEVGLRAQGAAV